MPPTGLAPQEPAASIDGAVESSSCDGGDDSGAASATHSLNEHAEDRRFGSGQDDQSNNNSDDDLGDEEGVDDDERRGDPQGDDANGEFEHDSDANAQAGGQSGEDEGGEELHDDNHGRRCKSAQFYSDSRGADGRGQHEDATHAVTTPAGEEVGDTFDMASMLQQSDNIQQRLEAMLETPSATQADFADVAACDCQLATLVQRHDTLHQQRDAAEQQAREAFNFLASQLEEYFNDVMGHLNNWCKEADTALAQEMAAVKGAKTALAQLAQTRSKLQGVIDTK